MPSSSYLKLSLFFVLTTVIIVQGLTAKSVYLSSDTIPPSPSPEQPVVKERAPTEMFGGIREEMPLFSDCGGESNYASRKKCTDSLLIAFIYDNLRYPYKAWQDSVEGFAVVSFAIEKDGTVSDTRIIRDPGTGTGKEALRLVNLMNKRHARWVPGTQAGKPVRVQFNLPVKFKMADHEFPPLPPPPPPVVEELFVVIRHVPGFSGCEDKVRGPLKKACQEKMLQRFIYDNLVYPELAKNKRMEGTAVVSFYVEKDGTVSSQKILKNPGMGMGEEAMRLIKLMKSKGLRWEPGPSYSRHYRTLFHLSIEFRLRQNEYIPTPPTLVQIWEAPDTYPYIADTISILNSAFRINRIPDLAPVFPGGDASSSPQEQQQYTSDQLRAYFKTNFKHQTADVHLGGKGNFVINFIVEKDGRISTVSVTRDPGGGVAAAAVRVVNQMINEDIRWLPGKKGNYKTAAEISIPISLIPKGKGSLVQVKRQPPGASVRRKTQSSSVPAPPPPPLPITPEAKKQFSLATNMKDPPLFPGCEDLGSYSEKQQCAAAKLEEFLQGNLRFPEKALERGVEGIVLISFIVEKDGTVNNGRILHDLGMGTGKEALRLVQLLNTKGLKFSPQKSGGRAVRVMYTVPIRFEIK